MSTDRAPILELWASDGPFVAVLLRVARLADRIEAWFLRAVADRHPDRVLQIREADKSGDPLRSAGRQLDQLDAEIDRLEMKAGR